MDTITNTPTKTAQVTKTMLHQPQDALLAVRNDLLVSIMITSVLTNLALFIGWLAKTIA